MVRLFGVYKYTKLKFMKMTATATLRRTQEKVETWSSIFPQEQVTETQSAVFVKKLLAVAVSNITYLRGIFPEQAFADRNLDDLHLKILRDDGCCPGACHVIRWMKGCFDALEKKYLRVLTIGLYNDPNNPETIFESYTFKFSYAENPGIDIYRNDQKISAAHSAVETKKATVRMLRTIVVLMQTLHSLPENVMMTMKLQYYDDVTPADYEPPNFKPCDMGGFSFEEESMNIKVGDVATAYSFLRYIFHKKNPEIQNNYSVKLRIKTNARQFEMVDGLEADEKMEATDTQEKQPASTTLQEIQNTGLDHEEDVLVSQNTDEHAAVNGITDSSVEEERPTAAPSFDDQSVPQPVICEDVPLDTPVRPTSCDQAVVPSAGTVSSVTNSLEESDYGVKCPCGCNEDDGLMVFCASCNYWQHAVCFRILDENAAPERHICSSCADPTDENLKPTDPQLIGLNKITLQATCLWRRALLACTEMTRVLLPKLACRLGVEMAVAQGIMKRLEKEEYLNSSAKNKRLGKVVNKDLLRNFGLIKYFKQKELSPDQENLSQRFDACKKLSGGYSSQNQNKIDEMEQIAERTGVISLSGVPAKPDSPSSAVTQPSQEIEYCKPEQDVQQSPHLQAQTEQTADKQRSGKRVHSTTDKSCEFEVSNSQDFTQGESERRSKRKRFSVVTRPIMV